MVYAGQGRQPIDLISSCEELLIYTLFQHIPYFYTKFFLHTYCSSSLQIIFSLNFVFSISFSSFRVLVFFFFEFQCFFNISIRGRVPLTYLLAEPRCLPEIFSVQIFVQVKQASFDVWTDSRTSEYLIGLTSKEPNQVGQNLNYSSTELRTEPQLFQHRTRNESQLFWDGTQN